ncbi:MAG: hypothetical protein D9V47_09655 [Clostridia bacterium]|nr:MAG: hypothetical protein D9V47_09655 [Clostridia bacterium]
MKGWWRPVLTAVVIGLLAASLIFWGGPAGGYAVGQAVYDTVGDSVYGGDRAGGSQGQQGGALLTEPSVPPAVGEAVYAPPPPPPDTEPPATPAGLAVENPGTGTSLVLTWQANTEEDLQGYRLYRAGERGGPNARMGEGEVDAFEARYVDVSVARNASYWYRVSAVDVNGNKSPLSEPVAGTALDVTPPAVPQGFKVRELDTGHDLEISWAANTEEDLGGYTLYRAADPEGPFEAVASLQAGATAYLDTGLVQGRWYYYRLTALDTTGNESEPTATRGARPRQAVTVAVYQDGAAGAAEVLMGLDSTAVFLNVEDDCITVTARAFDGRGAEVPLAGRWRFAAAFGRFTQAQITGTGEAEARFTADSPGEGEIAVEFYSAGAEEPASSDAAVVRGLEWHVELEASGDRTVTGGSDIILTARVTDRDGRPVTDQAAAVVFQRDGAGSSLARAVDEGERRRPKIGRWHGEGRASALMAGRDAGVSRGRPGAGGQVEARWVASTVPGKDAVRAVLLYDDLNVGGQRVKEVDVSRAVKIRVEPGPARYVGWAPETVVLADGGEAKAEIRARDAFGNATPDTGDLKVWLQVPLGVPLELSGDGGKNWVPAGEWADARPGREVRVRPAPEAEEIWAGSYFVNTRLEGSSLSPPSGVAQANLPLQVTIEKDIVRRQEPEGLGPRVWRSLLEMGARLLSALGLGA